MFNEISATIKACKALLQMDETFTTTNVRGF